MGHIITVGITSDKPIHIPSTKKERTQKVVELCDFLVYKKGVLYIDDVPFIKANFDKFILYCRSIFTFDLDVVYEKYQSAIIQLIDKRTPKNERTGEES